MTTNDPTATTTEPDTTEAHTARFKPAPAVDIDEDGTEAHGRRILP